MENGVVLTGLVPHPPLLIPQIGKKERGKVQKTLSAMERFAREVVAAEPDVIVLISPHGPVFQDGIVMNFAPKVDGDFADFGAAEERLAFVVDGPFAGAIQDEAQTLGVEIIPLTLDLVRRFQLSIKLDHGAMVPLYFLHQAGWHGRVVSVTMGMLPTEKLYAFGVAVQRAAHNFGRRAVVIASGDLSHRLSPDAPNGFHPRSKEFDEAITRLVERADIQGLLSLPADLREDAGECGYRPIVMMAGAADGYQVESEFFSYEAPFGVGYAVAAWRVGAPDESRRYLDWANQQAAAELACIRANEAPIVRLAREAAELYVREGKTLTEVPELPAELPQQAGVFVSVYHQGNLRGCIGTFVPTQPTLAQEVVFNAIQAVSNDPRFNPVTVEELPELVYSVDVLKEPREVEDLSTHDPKVHGIIVAKGDRRGLLLPDLPGVETTEQQLAIAKRKAGIGPDEKDVHLAEFEVIRYR